MKFNLIQNFFQNSDNKLELKKSMGEVLNL